MDGSDEKKLGDLLRVLEVDLLKFSIGAGKLILISGGTCTGKTSLAKRIMRIAPQFKILNTGDFFRDEAKKMGVRVGEFMSLPDDVLVPLDKRVDKRVVAHLIETDENLILTSRFASVWGEVLKIVEKPVFSLNLEVDDEAKLSRMAHREFRKGPQELTVNERKAIERELGRDRADPQRYERIYGLNPLSFNKYAYRLNTSKIDEAEVWRLIKPLVNSYIVGRIR